jgi:hypothetical protein
MKLGFRDFCSIFDLSGKHFRIFPIPFHLKYTCDGNTIENGYYFTSFLIEDHRQLKVESLSAVVTNKTYHSMKWKLNIQQMMNDEGKQLISLIYSFLFLYSYLFLFPKF